MTLNTFLNSLTDARSPKWGKSETSSWVHSTMQTWGGFGSTQQTSDLTQALATVISANTITVTLVITVVDTVVTTITITTSINTT